MDKKRFLLVSDPHLCHIDWYGVSTAERMERLFRDIKSEYEKEPFEAVFFLGDYSLDHWIGPAKGSYLALGICNTANFTELCRENLAVPFHMIAGNHEQYGNEKWLEITGSNRSFNIVSGDFLFVFLDAFGAGLDPAEHSDGTYAASDAGEIKRLLEENPDKKVIFFAHFFDISKEPPEMREILRDDRVVCVFVGHTHHCRVLTLPKDCNSKKIINCGNYSYSGEKNPLDCMWGFRDLRIGANEALTRYIVPENDIVIKEEKIHTDYHYQDEVILIHN